MSDELKRGLTLIGVPEYLGRLVANGFDTWETFLLITHDDMLRLRISADHGKLLLAVTAICQNGRQGTIVSLMTESKGAAAATQPHGRKRKYRRHPKPDPNAPKRPLTAYAAFLIERQKDMSADISFTARAKEIGREWQMMPDGEKDQRMRDAQAEIAQYRATIIEYRQTEDFQRYKKYVEAFKAEEAVRDIDKGETASGSSRYATDDQDPPDMGLLDIKSTILSGGEPAASSILALMRALPSDGRSGGNTQAREELQKLVSFRPIPRQAFLLSST
jgi:hypothetical protein